MAVAGPPPTEAKAAPAAQPILRMRGIVKEFPGVQALAGVDLEVLPGEVHALVGENGAGKSTLIRILGGVHQPDGGEIFLRGQPAVSPTPRRANWRGMSFTSAMRRSSQASRAGLGPSSKTWTTSSTKKELRLEICSKCHPFFTGKQKLVDSAGRVERFRKRYEKKPTGAPA